MNNKLIWIIDLNYKNIMRQEHIEIEVFEGRNKYTKKGIFSGPLRSNIADDYLEKEDIKFIANLKDVSQVSKNKFIVSIESFYLLISYFKDSNIDTLYCKLSDKKMHHVNYISYSSTLDKLFYYDSLNGELRYSKKNIKIEEKKMAIIISKPSVNLYLCSENKSIRGYLFFLYNKAEIPSNSSLENIQTNSETLLRNIQYENKVRKDIYDLGAKRSQRNEFTFTKKNFFEATLPKLYATDFKLYWGNEKKAISKTPISFSISYDVDWFSIQGSVGEGEHIYLLSDLLKSSKGKTYAEINNKILFIPEALRNLKNASSHANVLKLPINEISQVNYLANILNIDPSVYLKNFLPFDNTRYNMEKNLESQLKKYQLEGVKWILTLYKNRFGGCLADDMGLGKTIQAIAFTCCTEVSNKGPFLFVVPKIVLYNWKNEFNKFAPHKKIILVYGDFDYSQLATASGEFIYLTTYETVIYHKNKFEEVFFDSIILDEAQYLKNFRTQRYKSFKNIRRNFMLALTGTPIENNIAELWSIFNLLNPGLLGNFQSFVSNFVDINTNEKKMEKVKKIISPFFLRRTKEAVLKELPIKTEQNIYCEMNNKQRALYEKIIFAIQNDIKKKSSRYTIKDNTVILQALLYLREVCSDPQLLPYTLRENYNVDSCKFELFKNYAQEIMVTAGKMIVFSQFPRTLKQLQAWCTKQNWETYYIDGLTNNRDLIVSEFEKTDCGIFFVSLKAGGVGLNLVSCQYVIIYEPWWNSSVEQQAANRVYRIGQTKPVFIYHFLVRNSIEEKIHSLQQQKQDLFDGIVQDMDTPGRYSMKEIISILLQD